MTDSLDLIGQLKTDQRFGGRKLRVAIFTETFLPKIDGVVSILCLMLRRLNELGYEVILFGPPGGPAEFAGARIVGVGGPRAPFYPELRLNIARPRTWRQVQQFQPDLIHVVHPFVLGVAGLWYAHRLGVPVVASFHTHLPRYVQHYGYGWVSPLIWAYERFLHNKADLNLCTSTAMKAELEAQGFERVHWWKRGIDIELFCPGPVDPAMRSRLTSGHPDDFLVVNVGRQAPEKGLAGLRDYIFPNAGVRLALIGDGPSHQSLKRHFAGTPTVLPGYMQGDELVAAYRAADAFIFPSTTETFGLVALEAMACRVPVIAARVGGCWIRSSRGSTVSFLSRVSQR
ncbi:MAG: glycosyltransferase family 1 protein [Anaerolineae bacterium]|nr:glycosyltransferase family 1 protein [Anaerolineae bacterium]